MVQEEVCQHETDGVSECRGVGVSATGEWGGRVCKCGVQSAECGIQKARRGAESIIVEISGLIATGGVAGRLKSGYAGLSRDIFTGHFMRTGRDIIPTRGIGGRALSPLAAFCRDICTGRGESWATHSGKTSKADEKSGRSALARVRPHFMAGRGGQRSRACGSLWSGPPPPSDCIGVTVCRGIGAGTFAFPRLSSAFLAFFVGRRKAAEGCRTPRRWREFDAPREDLHALNNSVRRGTYGLNSSVLE
jgi:hypothetical protein